MKYLQALVGYLFLDFCVGGLVLLVLLALLSACADPQTPPPMIPDSVSTVNPGPEETP